MAGGCFTAGLEVSSRRQFALTLTLNWAPAPKAMISSSPPLSLKPGDAARLLIQAVQEISSARSLEKIISLATHVARRGSGAEGVSFVLREGDLCYYADEDAIGPLWKGRRFPMSECVSGWAMHHRLAVVIPDIMLDDRVPHDAYKPTFVRSLVMVPIRSMDPVGAIGAYWASIHRPDAETVHWLQALADATSAGIEAVRATTEAEALAKDSGWTAPSSENESVRMCAWTKRFFHDGSWLSVEAFLRARFGVYVTHGMSDDAVRRLDREINTRTLRRELY